MSRPNTYIKTTDVKIDCTNSVDPRLIHKYYKNLGGKVDRDTFGKVIRAVDKEIAEMLCNGDSVKLPYRMGELFPVKIPVKKRIVNGKLKVNAPINWYLTTQLWKEDEYAKKKNQVIRYDVDYKAYIIYRKAKSRYINKSLYLFGLNLDLRARFIKRFFNKEIDLPVWN